MLPSDFSTASLLKNTGTNLTASKLSQEAGRDFKIMILRIMQKKNVMSLTALKRILS